MKGKIKKINRRKWVFMEKKKNIKRKASSFFKNVFNGSEGSIFDIIKEIINVLRQISKNISKSVNSILSKSDNEEDEEEN